MLWVFFIIIIIAAGVATVKIGAAAWKKKLIEQFKYQTYLGAQIYPCQLFIDYQFNKPKDEVIVDMSLYEAYKIIFIQVFSETPPSVGFRGGIRRIEQACVANVCGMWMWEECY